MTAERLIEQLQAYDPKSECLFAEYDKGTTRLWHMDICCNDEHQRKVGQVWFSRNMLADSIAG